MKDKLLNDIDNLLQTYCSAELMPKESQEWYLRNHLVDLKHAVDDGSKAEVEKASRLLVRFCVDTMDWESDIYRDAAPVGEAGMKLSKRM